MEKEIYFKFSDSKFTKISDFFEGMKTEIFFKNCI